MRSGVAQALRPRVWHDCALFFFDLGISNFTGFGTRLGRILSAQNQRKPFYPVSRSSAHCRQEARGEGAVLRAIKSARDAPRGGEGCFAAG